jgi:hypothetical protein
MFKPTMLDCFSGRIRHGSVAHEPGVLLVGVHFIAKKAVVNFVAVPLGHSMMIPFTPRHAVENALVSLS